jgi:signal transduction histidine kinase
MECRGRRRNGEVFLAQVWLSTFSTASGPRLAAIILDASSDLRDREEVGLQRLMISSRVLVRAVSHEIRNLCAAIAVVHANLRRVPGLAGNEDYLALGTLAEGLGRLVSAELRPSLEDGESEVDLHEVLDELRIIIEPSFKEDDAAVRWQVPDDLPRVLADHHGLLHVFMNLANNSQRAMRQSEQKELAISAAVEHGRVVVRFNDTGAGVADPDNLFKAFHQTSGGAGLGLYVSRALVRAFAGELRHEPQVYGCCFAVDLARAHPIGVLKT